MSTQNEHVERKEKKSTYSQTSWLENRKSFSYTITTKNDHTAAGNLRRTKFSISRYDSPLFALS
jgi:hypothetical protein